MAAPVSQPRRVKRGQTANTQSSYSKRGGLAARDSSREGVRNEREASTAYLYYAHPLCHVKAPQVRTEKETPKEKKG